MVIIRCFFCMTQNVRIYETKRFIDKKSMTVDFIFKQNLSKLLKSEQRKARPFFTKTKLVVQRSPKALLVLFREYLNILTMHRCVARRTIEQMLPINTSYARPKTDADAIPIHCCFKLNFLFTVNGVVAFST